jgi:hypothetical protein
VAGAGGLLLHHRRLLVAYSSISPLLTGRAGVSPDLVRWYSRGSGSDRSPARCSPDASAIDGRFRDTDDVSPRYCQ